MLDAVDTVNMSAQARTTYRHGALREALVEAGVELARTGGPQAVVLREATRRVGVSANAAYRHFADHRALLRAVGVVAMGQLAARMEQEQGRRQPTDARSAARARLRGVGAGYLLYAREQPGLFRTAFAVNAEVADEPGTRGGSGFTPLELLTTALDGLVDAGLLPSERRPNAEVLAWSAVHGLSMLLIDGPLVGSDDTHVDALCEKLLDHVEAGLLHTV